jgi:uncharacterized protein YndB with AHSA1/START domain
MKLDGLSSVSLWNLGANVAGGPAGEGDMKYADGPTVEVDILVAAPIERVWALVSDIDLPARFSGELLGARWIDDTPKVGARFAGRSHHDALGNWETTSFVARYDPPRAFEWAVSDLEAPSASWWFDLDEAANGTTLRQGMRMGPAPSGLSLAITAMPDKEEKIIARRLAEHERNIQATLEGIKQLAEAVL